MRWGQNFPRERRDRLDHYPMICFSHYTTRAYFDCRPGEVLIYSGLLLSWGSRARL